MKKVLFFALAGALLAGCTSNEFEGNVSQLESGNGEISFSMSTPNITRGTASDANKLDNEFVVYGWKQTPRQTVFDNYTVNYVEGSNNSTLSNTNGWEYVGKTTQPFSGTGVKQSIKYWDYSAAQYDFLAWRILSGSAATITGLKTDVNETDYKDTALVFQAPSASDLAKIYIANQVTVEKGTNGANYNKVVEFTFRNLSAKVRLGIYETVPGYSVKDVKFYKDSLKATTSEATPYLFVTAGSKTKIPTAGTVLVKYQKADNVAVAKTTASASLMYFKNGTGFDYQTAAAEYMESSSYKYIGRTSNAATYPTADENGYTYAFPHDTLELNLKVDYTLVSIDGKEETITVKGATAVVPEQYGAWKANHAYTYLFKISDKTNGHTGETTDPEGLYPITFDACVEVAETSGSQENVTTVSTPTFTTYQSGINVTANNEYKAGAATTDSIYVTLYDQGTSKDIALIPSGSSSNVKLYSVVSTDGTALTEANVANYANNGIILTDRTADLVQTDSVLNVGKFATKLVRFYPVQGKVYAVEYTKDSKKYYKVIKVDGAATTSFAFETYKIGVGPETTFDECEKFNVVIIEDQLGKRYPVLNAVNKFATTVTNVFDIQETANAGVYDFTSKAGTSGGYTISLPGVTGSVGVNINAYEFANNNVDVIADYATGATITLNLGGAAAAEVDDGTNFEVSSELFIASVADGVVTLKAGKTAQNGTITYKNNGTVVASATVTVLHYSFTATNSIINVGSVETAEKSTDVTMQLGGSAISAATNITVTADPNTALSGTAPTATDATGKVALTAGTTAGTITVKASDDNSISIEVTNFTVTVDESASPVTVTFKNSDTAQDVTLTPSTGNLTKTSSTGVYTWDTTPTTNATITYTYKGVTFTLYKKS